MDIVINPELVKCITEINVGDKFVKMDDTTTIYWAVCAGDRVRYIDVNTSTEKYFSPDTLVVSITAKMMVDCPLSI